MKTLTIKFLISSLALALFLAGCSNFDDINDDPDAVTDDEVFPEYLLNQSIVGTQMNPDVAERAFVLNWKNAGRQQAEDNGYYKDNIQVGDADDSFIGNYWGQLTDWLKYANRAITVGEQKDEEGTAEDYNDNIIQISRIWRVYLMSELADNFGPEPINGFQGENPDFDTEEDVYHFMLDELKEAVDKIDPDKSGMEDQVKDSDVAYDMDWDKWIRYGNSMRMRLAMRLSEVEPDKAQSEFEDAVEDEKFISTEDQNFAVQEKDGWDDITGVMSRIWNEQMLSETMNNLMVGLGGIASEDQLDDEDLKNAIEDEDYIGMYFPDAYPENTNDPYVGYFFDGLPHSIDPRAYINFYIPGYKDNEAYTDLFEVDDDEMVRDMEYEDGTEKEVDTKWTWSTYVGGDWGSAKGRNGAAWNASFVPALADQYRTSENDRVFFGSWESYFLIAEAALKGWSTPLSDEEAYNRGIEESMDYNGVGGYSGDYEESTDYNRNGTSVKYSHTVEPPASHTMTYIDGKSGDEKTVSINYPKNTVYENGSTNNDKLTKIITQKFIANTPWLPLETWSDHRRLGLPFFENPAAEHSLSNLPNFDAQKASFANYPKRLPYPSSLRNSDAEGYQQAVDLLNGDDAVTTPLWWSKANQ